MIKIHTLCYNLVSEAERAVSMLYAQNDMEGIEYCLFDIGFPIEYGDVIPDDIDKAKKNNSIKLQEIASKYGCGYHRMENVGVSQNWEQAARVMNVEVGDCFIGCDIDEFPQNDGWVNAMNTVMETDDRFAVVSLIMKDQKNAFTPQNSIQKNVGGVRVLDVTGNAMWPLIAISGKFITDVGGIPVPNGYHRYGHLEGACLQEMRKLNYRWCMLKDYYAVHTDRVPLYRSWKDQIIFRKDEYGQLSFEDFLTMKREGT